MLGSQNECRAAAGAGENTQFSSFAYWKKQHAVATQIITVDHNDVEVTSEINMILSQNANTSKNPPGFIIMFQL